MNLIFLGPAFLKILQVKLCSEITTRTHSFQSLSCWRVWATLVVFLIVFSHALDHAATALAHGLALLVRHSSSVLFVFSDWFHFLAPAFAFGFCICVRELPLQTLSMEEGRSNMLTISSSSPAVCFANYLLLRKTEKKLSSHISRKARANPMKGRVMIWRLS